MESPGARPADSTPAHPDFSQERRRARRHKVFIPAYANLSGSSQGVSLELSEILNISASGVCIQASSPMKVDRLLPLGVDLSGTDISLRMVGHVVWSEASGKTGIRFPEMGEAALGQLERWLVGNSKAEAIAGADAAMANAGEIAKATPDVPPLPTSGYGYTSLVTEWAEIEKEVELSGSNLERTLNLIAQRALTLTWASGTAIALINKLNPAEMICRARAGTDSPGMGVLLETGSGFSGQCVRTAATLKCDDSEYDSRVDRQICRSLGIRSIVACPVKRNHEVIGILEVFSPEPAAFWENDVNILDRLAVAIERAVRRAERTNADILSVPFSGASLPVSPEAAPPPPAENPEPPATPLPLSRKALLLLTAIVWMSTVMWLINPWIEKLSLPSSSVASASPPATRIDPDTYVDTDLKELKILAAAGDAAARYQLGRRYATGDGVKQNYEEAMRWFLQAADQGNVKAQAKASTFFLAGRGVPQDHSKAYYWALLAQAGGDKDASLFVAQSAPYLSPAQIDAEHLQAENWLHSHHIGHASPESSR